jgi:diguanylate cyclase (GGDEF)-like protein
LNPIKGKRSLLLVDDEPASVEICKRVLESLSHDLNVIVCKTGEEALLELTKNNVILVLCDIVLPGMSGLDVAENVKRLNPAAGVIMMTAYPSVESSVRLLRMGVDDYLEKPLDTLELELAIKRSLGKEKLIEKQSPIGSFLSLVTNCRLISSTQELKRMAAHADCYLQREFGNIPRAFYRLGEKRKWEQASDYPGLPFGSLSFAAKRVASKGNNEIEVIEWLKIRYLRINFMDGMVWVGKLEWLSNGWEERVKCLVEHFRSAIETAEKIKEAEELAHTDDVTGLFNVRRLNSALDETILECEVNKREFSVLFVDLDHFKNINDSRGHLVGSQLLVEIGKEIERILREEDQIFRYGGDEFVIILKNTNLDLAKQVAERLKNGLSKKRFLSREGLDIRLTASIGVATFPVHAKNKQDILDVADQAMYAAKKTSRNAVYVAEVKSA